MSDTASGLPNEREAPFVDPWSKEPNHQDVVPIDAVFVGTWDNDVGIFEITEALFLVRDDRQDLLWSLTTYSKSELSCGCVAGAPREGTQSEAASGRTRACKGWLAIFTAAISAWPPREQRIV